MYNRIFNRASRRFATAATHPKVAKAGFGLGRATATLVGVGIVVGGLVYADLEPVVNLTTKTLMAVAGPVVGIYSSADHVTGSFRQQKLTFTNMKASRSNSKESNFNFEMPSVELDFSKESLWARAFGSKAEKEAPFRFESVKIAGMKGTFEKTGDSDTPNFAFGSLLIENADVAVSESLDIKKNAIVEKKSQTVKLPSVTIRSLGFKNLVLRKPDLYNFLTTTIGSGTMGGQDWVVNPAGTEGENFEVRFKDMPIAFMGSYLVYPFYLINSASLDIAMTMRKTNEIPKQQQFMAKLNQLKDLKDGKDASKDAEKGKAVDANEPRYICDAAVTFHNIKMTKPDQATIDKESVGLSVGAAVLSDYLANNATKVSIGFTNNVAKSEFEPKQFGQLAAQSMVAKAAVDSASKAWSWFSGKN